MPDVKCPKCQSVMSPQKVKASVGEGALDKEGAPRFGELKRKYLNAWKCPKCGYKMIYV